MARNCTNEAAKTKALTEVKPNQVVLSLSGAQQPRGGTTTTFRGCLGGEDYVPVHRRNNVPVTCVAKARRGIPQPRGCIMGECIDSAFTRHKLQLMEESSSEDVDPLCGACPRDQCELAPVRQRQRCALTTAAQSPLSLSSA